MPNPKERRLKEKLELRDFKLNALLKVTQAINAQSSEEDLMQHYVDALKSNLGIDRLVLYAAELDGQQWKLLVSAGTDSSWPEWRPASFFESLDLESIGLAGAMGGDEHPSDVVVPIHQNDEAIAVVLAGDTTDDDRGVSPVVKHLNFLVTLTNILVVARRNNQMVARDLKQVAIRRELELAGEMQAMLLPNAWDHLDLDVAGYYQPHTEVGGDYYDAFSTAHGNIVMCMADVSGKGMSAALLMSNFQFQMDLILLLKQLLTDTDKILLKGLKTDMITTSLVPVQILLTKFLSISVWNILNSVTNQDMTLEEMVST